MYAKVLIALAAALLAASCATYHAGVTLPKDLRCVALDEVVNQTSEPSLTPWFRKALVERLEATPGMRTSGTVENADLAVTVRIVDLNQSQAARARTREHDARHRSSEAYQTVLYRYTVTWEYRVTGVKANLLLADGRFETTADLPKMPDLEIARKTAVQEAARAAGERLAEIITER